MVSLLSHISVVLIVPLSVEEAQMVVLYMVMIMRKVVMRRSLMILKVIKVV